MKASLGEKLLQIFKDFQVEILCVTTSIFFTLQMWRCSLD